MRVLILGGTAEGRALAGALDEDGVDVVSSLAGRVARPRLPVGEVRIGGFGGVAGLRAAALGFDAVVDATHPFSAQISANAAAACRADVPLLRLERAGWTTLETRDLAAALATPAPVLVDCLGTWLTAVLDTASAWDQPAAAVEALVGPALDDAVAALVAHPGPVVLVTNEVGLGVVPEHRSGRLFRDLLGTVNQRLAADCDEVHLVVAGRVLVL